MARYGIRKYLGLIFMAVVIAPAIVLSLLAIRAISHEEAYIEKQMEGTLSAEVTHLSSIVAAELGRIHGELEATAMIPGTGDPTGMFGEWKRRSALVEVPFLISPEHEILWPSVAYKRTEGSIAGDESPSAAKKAVENEHSFVEKQQAFLSDEEEIPVYENIAVAFQNEILGETEEADEPALSPDLLDDVAADDTAAGLPPVPAHAAASREREMRSLGVPEAASRGPYAAAPPGEQSRKQAAITQFQQSEEVRQRVFDRAELEGQKLAYRNIDIPRAGKAEDAVKEDKKQAITDAAPTDDALSVPPSGTGKGDVGPDFWAETPVREKGASGEQPEPEGAGRIRSIFISQPLRFSEIVAGGQSGLIPRTIDGSLRHLYWQKLADGNIMGCLIDSREFRERIIGSLPNIYSPVRILTVLDERGEPLVVPQGREARDWRSPFVAHEISELLPRWESAAYLTEPDAITSRAQATTMVMWILILILFVSILGGSILVLRSAYAEVRLARQRTSFVANVSHELKTPLTSIRMFAEMLRDGRQADPQKQKHYLDVMTAETERLTRLINNVLDFSRMERGEKRYNMRISDLVALTRDVVESERARLESNGFEVVLTTRAGRLPVNADQEAIKQAILNLLSNAEKYSPQVKEIKVVTGRDRGEAVVRVHDRGVGIPPEKAKNIFDEFYRVDDALTSEVKGTGLGLTIARKILKDHGGAIRYTGREGGGSTFEIRLPVAEGERLERS